MISRIPTVKTFKVLSDKFISIISIQPLSPNLDIDCISYCTCKHKMLHYLLWRLSDKYYL